jgi:hypothetical protein
MLCFAVSRVTVAPMLERRGFLRGGTRVSVSCADGVYRPPPSERRFYERTRKDIS